MKRILDHVDLIFACLIPSSFVISTIVGLFFTLEIGLYTLIGVLTFAIVLAFSMLIYISIHDVEKRFIEECIRDINYEKQVIELMLERYHAMKGQNRKHYDKKSIYDEVKL